MNDGKAALHNSQDKSFKYNDIPFSEILDDTLLFIHSFKQFK